MFDLFGTQPPPATVCATWTVVLLFILAVLGMRFFVTARQLLAMDSPRAAAVVALAFAFFAAIAWYFYYVNYWTCRRALAQ